MYEDDEHAHREGVSAADNQEWREEINASPEDFIEIPGLSHGEHHQILKEFLDSDWAGDKSVEEWARLAYAKSISGWMKRVDGETVDAYSRFKDQRAQQLAEEFLRSHGIEPRWQ